jgi:ABC-type transport system involved in multi-copper enzyme maturation permease subunit
MISPVLDLELLQGSRRNGLQLLRRIYTGWLVLQFLFFYWLYLIEGFADSVINRGHATNAAAEFIEKCISTLIFQQFWVVALATPALTAGAITDEKTRGTLQYLLTTEASGWDIVVGKMLGRIWQLFLLVLASLPLATFLAVLGGLPIWLLLGPYLLILIPGFALASASLLASVWCRQTRDAVLVVYIGLLALAGVVAWSNWAQTLNPLLVLEAASDDRVDSSALIGRTIACLLAWFGIGLGCLALASWRLRSAYLRQLQRAGLTRRQRWWSLRRKPVSDDPLRWKESQVEGVAPLIGLRRVPRWLGVSAVAAATTLAGLTILGEAAPGYPSAREVVVLLAGLPPAQWSDQFQAAGDGFRRLGLVAMFLATLLLGLRCSGAVTGERERQTWEALLLTPLAVKQLLRSKLWGIVGASYPYLFAYALPALLLSFLGGPAAFLWTLFLLGLTWLAMGYAGSAGLWCSARSSSSWRSLLATIGLGYAATFVVYTFSMILVPIVFLLILLGVYLADLVIFGGQGNLSNSFAQSFIAFTTMSYVALGLTFVGLTGFLLSGAQRYIADRERTRIWRKEVDDFTPTVIRVESR